MRRSAGDLMGDVLYHIVLFGVEKFGLTIRQREELLVRIYEVDPEPERRFCLGCDDHTMWELCRWVLEGEEAYECVECGKVE